MVASWLCEAHLISRRGEHSSERHTYELKCMNLNKLNIDSRTWIVATVGCAVLLLAGSVLISQPVNSALERVPVRLGTFNFPGLHMAAVAIALWFLMPCVLTVIARNRPILWGIVPYVIILGFAISHYGHIWSYLSGSTLAFTSILWLLSSGVGLFVRRIIRRSRAKKAASAPLAAPAETAMPRVWPPAPR